jgi:hypothetical protein
MASNRTAIFAIVLNLLMTILLFTASELTLLRILGYEVASVDTSIQFEFPLTPGGTLYQLHYPFQYQTIH